MNVLSFYHIRVTAVSCTGIITWVGTCVPLSRRMTGGIESNAGSLIISVTGTAWFTRNNAIAAGGAISLTAPVEVKISNVIFAANTAKNGGAISVDSTTHNDRRVYENCMFEDNMATDGGAVYLFGGAGLDYVTSSIFRNNFASKSPTYNWLTKVVRSLTYGVTTACDAVFLNRTYANAQVSCRGCASCHTRWILNVPGPNECSWYAFESNAARI